MDHIYLYKNSIKPSPSLKLPPKKYSYLNKAPSASFHDLGRSLWKDVNNKGKSKMTQDFDQCCQRVGPKETKETMANAVNVGKAVETNRTTWTADACGVGIQSNLKQQIEPVQKRCVPLEEKRPIEPIQKKCAPVKTKQPIEPVQNKFVPAKVKSIEPIHQCALGKTPRCPPARGGFLRFLWPVAGFLLGYYLRDMDGFKPLPEPPVAKPPRVTVVVKQPVVTDCKDGVCCAEGKINIYTEYCRDCKTPPVSLYR